MMEMSDGFVAHRLSHKGHQSLAEWLILARFKAFLSLLSPPLTGVGRQRELIMTLHDTLSDIARCETSEGGRALFESAFGSVAEGAEKPPAGCLVRQLLEVSRAANVAVVLDSYSYLRALSFEFLERYYVAYQLTGPSDAAQTTIRYRYIQPYDNFVKGARAGFRHRMRAPTPDLRIHIPLARQTDSYTARMTAPSNYYFFSASIQYLKPAAESPPNDADEREGMHTAPRRYYMRKDKAIVNVLDTVIEPSQGQRAHVFLADGSKLSRRQHGPLHLWLALRERPPGTTLRAFLATSLTFAVCSMLLAWQYVYKVDGLSIAPLLATLLAFAGLTLEALTPDTPLLKAPVTPRVSLVIQSFAALMFALWLLSRGAGPPKPGTGWSTLSFVWISWHAWGGLIIIALLAGLTGFLWRRSRHVARSYHSRVER
jgi:hypothetical protein